MRFSRGHQRSLQLALLAGALLITLTPAACGASSVSSGATTSISSIGSASDMKPTLPPAPAGTATPTVMPNLTPAAAVGWLTYTDSIYHFKTVVPPGWRIGTVYDNTETNLGGPCSYDAIFFPPGDTHQADPLVLLQMREYMVIYVNLYCPPPDDTPNHLPESAGAIMVSGVPAKVYAEDTSDGVSVSRSHTSATIFTRSMSLERPLTARSTWACSRVSCILAREWLSR